MKDVPGYRGLYTITKDGVVTSNYTGKQLKHQTSKSERPYVCLVKSGHRQHHYIDDLIELTFYPKIKLVKVYEDED